MVEIIIATQLKSTVEPAPSDRRGATFWILLLTSVAHTSIMKSFLLNLRFAIFSAEPRHLTSMNIT